mmetsp:Transcript_27228/g.71704  ORF Transcript_27228/g.71704 Transcript_27228/m.71704 type:complete len:282 (+) Transcript_27228:250-1095(+)
MARQPMPAAAHTCPSPRKALLLRPQFRRDRGRFEVFQEPLEVAAERITRLHLEVVVVRIFDPERLVRDATLLACLVQLNAVQGGDDLVPCAMNDEDWAADVRYLVNIGEHVTRKRVPKLKRDPEDRQHRALEYQAPDSRARSEMYRRTSSNRTSVWNDLLPWDTDDVSHIPERSLDVRIDCRLRGLSGAHPVARVLVGEDIHMQDLAEFFETPDNESQILGVCVAEEKSEFSARPLQGERRDHFTTVCAQPNQVRILRVRRRRWLKDDCRHAGAHFGAVGA